MLNKFSAAIVLSSFSFCLFSVELEVNPEQSANITKNKYNTSFYRGGNEFDLQRFIEQGSLVEGDYRVELYLGNHFVSFYNVELKLLNSQVKPCLTEALLTTIGLSEKGFQQLYSNGQDGICFNLEQIEGASWSYDGLIPRLTLLVPQIYLQPRVRGNSVDPELWDYGVTAAFVNYNMSSNYSDYAGSSNTSHFIDLNSGFNVDKWRLYNRSHITVNDDKGELKSQQTYVERDLTAWRSQFKAGEIYSDTNIFQGVPRLRGFQISSDESMLPNELRGYSPVVTGVARSNAAVEIRQNGRIILKETVAPGPFIFRDIPTSGSNGDLEITVIEADGSREVRTQGFGMLSIMKRQGQGSYQFTAGEIDDAFRKDWYVGMDGAYGLFSAVTLFGGVQASTDYYALNSGLGFGSNFGNFSLDVTHANSDSQAGPRNEINQGQSYAFRYGRVWQDTGTTLALAGYRYSTEGYRTLSDHRDDRYLSQWSNSVGRTRNMVTLSVNQTLANNWGGLSLSASEGDYWNNNQRTRSLSGGYGNSWRSLNYHLSVQRNWVGEQEHRAKDTTFNLTFSHPLNFGRSNNTLSYSSNYQREDSQSHNAINLSGSRDKLSYYINSQRSGHGHYSVTGGVGVETAIGDGRISYSQGRNYHNLNTSWNGSIIAHPRGINLAPTLHNGATLVEIQADEPLQGIGFLNNAAKTSSNNIAVLRGGSSYSRNKITVDSQTLPKGVDMSSYDAQVIPRRGAVTHAVLTARRVQRVSFTLLDKTGAPYPFGTQLLTVEGKPLGMADPYGRALVQLEKQVGEFVIVNGKERCQVSDQFAPDLSVHFIQRTLQCGA